jgi:glycerol-3-phosphate O-acyltransferase/dihydroxyacetone phosphate acyltransferase
MAEASWKRPIVGDLAWAMGVVPVRRAQDDAKPGSGTIRLHPPNSSGKATTIIPTTTTAESPPSEQATIEVEGIATKFQSELAVGDKIRPSGTAHGLKIQRIDSDTKMIVEGSNLPQEFPAALFDDSTDPVRYDLLKRTPLTTVFDKVLERLAAGGALGIFPEGGSHDRTDLLPLKVGVALIAYSALEKDGLNIPIVPVGLNYFRAHRWRGRAVVEYGRPIMIDPSTLDDYKAGGARRRNVCNDLLADIEISMRSVIISAPDYETLELIHTARRLYKRKKGPLATYEKQDLSRRFVEGYKRLLLMTDGKPSQEWLDLQERIKEYREELKDLGIKDYQIPALREEHLDEKPLDVEKVDGDRLLLTLQLVYNIVDKLVLISLAAVPILLLNLPVGVLAGIYAEARRKKALAASKVKIKGYDVMMTEKILFCIFMVPTLWIVYGIILKYRTNMDAPTIALVMLSMPIFSYIGVVVAEAGIIDLFALRPHIMRLLPSSRKRLAELPAKRKQLQDDLRAYIRKIGPALGDIYYGKNLDWAKIQEKTKESALAEDRKKDE